MKICSICGVECEDDAQVCEVCGHDFSLDEGIITDREIIDEELDDLAEDPDSEDGSVGAMCYAPMP